MNSFVMNIFLHWAIFAFSVFGEGLSETEQTLSLPDELLHGTILRSSRHVSKFVNVHCDVYGIATSTLYMNHDKSGKLTPIGVIVDVEDTRDVETAIIETIQESPVIVVHVGLPSLPLVTELNEHRFKSRYIESIQSVLLWLSKNAIHLNGDKSSVTVIGLGRDGSYLVSALSMRSESRHIFRRGVVEYGEHTVLSIDGWFANQATSEAKFSMNPAPRELLVGYDRQMAIEDTVTGTVDFLEAFGNHGSRITLFERTESNVLWDSHTASLFSLWFEFCASPHVEEEIFPQLALGFWRHGITILSTTNGMWKARTVTNLLKPEVPYADSFPVKNISLGALRGRELQRGSFEAIAYYHIPYANKVARFQYPSMVDPWNDLVDARYPVLYKDCTQSIFVNFGHEDCLNLHIFIPKNIESNLDENPIPVMVFMHGGSFNTGFASGFRIPGRYDTSLYDGTVIADHAKVIVVSVNYRLGPLGFLNDGDLTVDALDGNYGMRDMVLAFEWIKKYISEFGGDPNEVTLFGESAGAAGTAVLALSPMMEGLIKRHIQESGSSLSFFAVDFNPRVLADQVTTEMGCRSEDYTKTKQCLLQRDEYDFMQLNWPADYVPWRPGVDGVFLTEDPAVTLTKSSNLDLLLGFNSDEVYIIAAAIVPKFFNDEPLTANDIALFRSVVNDLVLKYPDRQQYITDIIFHNAAGWNMDFSTQAVKESLVRASTDFVFVAPSIRQGILRSQTGSNSSNYVYNFDIKTKVRIFADWAYNSHAFELPYVFGEPLRKTEYDPVFNATQDMLSLQMITYWTNFAKSGNPNFPKTDNIDGITWDEFTADNQNYMRLDFRMTEENRNINYRQYEIELWNFLLPSLFQLDDDACTATQIVTDRRRDRAKKTLRKRSNSKSIAHDAVKYDLTFSNDTECSSDSCTIVSTSSGYVRGVVSEYGGVTVESFLGIPYAAPPTGDFRFSPTRSAPSWGNQTLEATSLMPDCPWNSTLEGQSEDCLYLNIYRPGEQQAQGVLFPTMVWIHPNMASGMGASAYDGRRIAAMGNVVVVTFNYRVGALGFLSTGGEFDSPAGNFGLLDQNMLLQWVNKNIQNFGASAADVTLFGDTEGSVAVGYHAVSTLTQSGYFQNIIHQSGVGQLNDQLANEDLENAQTLAQSFSCPTDVISNMVSCLKNISIEEFMQNAESYEPKVVVDGTFFRDQPKVLFEEDELTNSNEYAYLIAFTDGEGASEYEIVSATVRDRDSYKQYIEDEIAPDSEFINSPRIRVLLEYEYMEFNSGMTSEEQRYQRAAMDMYGDKHVVASSMAVANITNRRFQLIGSLRRNYVCKLTSPIDDEYPSWVGSPSGSFEKLFWGLVENPTPAVERLSDRIVAYWTSFARIRRPFGTSPDDAWLRYDIEEGHYGELEAQSEFALHRQYPRPKYSTLWNSLIPSIDIAFSCETQPRLQIPEVTLSNGVTLRGYADRVEDGRAYHTFRGLPYAEPPLGDKRFQDSTYFDNIEPSPGETVYSATIKRPRCLQTENGVRGGYADEDCLYLDIWQPEATESSSAVLLWICHGGQSVLGPHGQLTDDLSCDVDGRMMALDGNIIFVKIQYRIGILGFASTETSLIPGNAGLSDLMNGLRWVFNHIESFGGSKEKVSVGGVGYGSTLAMVLAGMSRSMTEGTVQNVIAQSGGINSLWAYSLHPSNDLQYVYENSDCMYSTTEEAVQCLRDMEAIKLINLAGNAKSNFPFGIYIESRPESSPDFTKESFMSMMLGNTDGVTIASLQNWLNTMPMLTGVNGAAGFHFTLEAYPEIQFLYNRGRPSIDLINSIIENDIFLGNFNSSFSEEQSEMLRNYYIPWGITDDGDQIRKAAVQYHTEGGFTNAMYDAVYMRIGDESGQAEDTFVYVYEEPSSVRQARRWGNSGSDLGEEIFVLFPVLGGDEASLLGKTMRQYWGTFTSRGSPNLLSQVRGRWDAYNALDRNVMILSSTSSRIVSGYRDQANTIWESVLPISSNNTAGNDSSPNCDVTPSTPITCPTDPVATCPEQLPIGTGIGLELSPAQADSAIEALFGISLAFLCLLIIAVCALLWKFRKSATDSRSVDSFALHNEAAISKLTEVGKDNNTAL